MEELDEIFMDKALTLAHEAMEDDEVPVGCVIVLDGRVIASGRNRREKGKNALAHAEIEAISKACAVVGGWRLVDTTLYVTLEPCPMCAGAIINARIARVVFGAYDPKAGVAGSVLDLFGYKFNHQPKVTGGVLKEPCSKILSTFFREHLAKHQPEKEKNEPKN